MPNSPISSQSTILPPIWAQNVDAHNERVSQQSYLFPPSPMSIAEAPAPLLFLVRTPLQNPVQDGSPNRPSRHRHHRHSASASHEHNYRSGHHLHSIRGRAAWAQASKGFQQFKQEIAPAGGYVATVGTGMVTGAVTQAIAKGKIDAQTAWNWADEQLQHYYPTPSPEQAVLIHAAQLTAGSVGASWGALSGLVIGLAQGAQEAHQGYQAEQGAWASMKQAFFNARAVNVHAVSFIPPKGNESKRSLAAGGPPSADPYSSGGSTRTPNSAYSQSSLGENDDALRVHSNGSSDGLESGSSPIIVENIERFRSLHRGTGTKLL